MELEKNMVLCIHLKNGDKKPFPIHETKMPYFVSTGYRVMTDEEEALYMKAAKIREESGQPITSGKPEISEQGRKDFEKFVNNQKSADVLEQAKAKFNEDWQKELIDKRISELTTSKEETKTTNK